METIQHSISDNILRHALAVIVMCLGIICPSCGHDDDDDDLLDSYDKNGVKSNGHEYVDLGLSVYWATCNVGATSPYDNGYYYAFGESSLKPTYSSDNYTGGSADVAALSWGGNWRLPTLTEIEELRKNCSWKLITFSNSKFAQATGVSGNTLILPFAGEKCDNTTSTGCGGIWTSTPYNSSKTAWRLFYNYAKIQSVTEYRYAGLNVRPVMTNPNYTTSGTGSGNSSSSGSSSGSSYEKPDIGFYDFTATKTSLKVQYEIFNKDEAKVTSAKIYYGTSSNPSTSTTATIAGRIITAYISGLKAGTTYYVKCTATGKGGSTTTSVTKCITNY